MLLVSGTVAISDGDRMVESEYPGDLLNSDDFRFDRTIQNLADEECLLAGGASVSVSGEEYEFVTKWGSDTTSDGMFSDPRGVAVDCFGNVYVVDNYNSRIQKFTSDGTFLLKWGPGSGCGDGDGEFNFVTGVAVDGSGNVYVADSGNDRIQKFASDGTFLTKWGSDGSGDGEFNYPMGVAVDSSGNIYVADTDNDRIQKFSSDGTFISKWGYDGSGDGEFNSPRGVGVDSSGNVYVVDTNNCRIQKFSSDGMFIMKWGSYGTGDGDFHSPRSVAIDNLDNIYVADPYNDRIQKFASDGTFIAKWGSRGSGDGEFSSPNGVAVDGFGNIYVVDSSKYCIQKFTSDGTFVAKWGSCGSGDGKFYYPTDVGVESCGNVYVADSGNDRIQKFSSDGTFITKWGSCGQGDGEFDSPCGVAIDNLDNIYVADSGNDRIQKFSSDGIFITKWGSCGSGDGEFYSPCGVAVDGSGNVYVADSYNNRIQKFASDGTFITKWGSCGSGDGEFYSPFDVAVDGSGNVYVADTQNNRIQKFSSDGTFLTKWGSCGFCDEEFYYPFGVAVDGSGNVYVANSMNCRVQKFSSDGTFITIFGFYGNGDGKFNDPEGVAVDGSGNVYVADSGNWRIQKFRKSGSLTEKILSVPYIHQVYDTPTGFNGEAACSETSAVMVLAYYGRLTPDPVVCEDKWVYGGVEKSLDPARTSVYGKYVSDEYTYRDTTFSESFTDTTQLDRTATGAGAWGWIENSVDDGVERPDAIVEYLELHDCDAEFIESPSAEDAFATISENIDNDKPVIARTYLGGATGHYAVIVGYSKDGDEISYYVNDPYGIEPYDLTVLVQHLDQPVEYSYDEMGLGDSTRGLIVVHPFLCVQPKNIEEKQITIIEYDASKSNTFADPLAISDDVAQIQALDGNKNDVSSIISLQFKASDNIENVEVIIKDRSGYERTLSPLEYKIEIDSNNNLVVCWDGYYFGTPVNQAKNPYIVIVTGIDGYGNVVTSDKAKVFVGRPILLVHGLNSDIGDIEGGLLYNELIKDYYVKTIEYNHLTGFDFLKYGNGFGNIQEYAQYLDSEIARIKDETGAKKVDIIAHSMGGLISRWRIQKISSGDNDVGKLIMMGTPNHGAQISKLPKDLTGNPFDLKSKVIHEILKNPNLAINQMNPGSTFLKMLNGGNSYWYDVALFENLENYYADSVSGNTQYYVLAGHDKSPTLHISPPEIILDDCPYLSNGVYGDYIVPFYSAKIANDCTPTYPLGGSHTSMWNNEDYLNKVLVLLDEPESQLPVHIAENRGGISSEMGLSQSGFAPLTSTEGLNSSFMLLLSTIDAAILPGTAHYTEFMVNNNTDLLSCLALWESGTMEIGLTDPEGLLRADDTGETMSQLTVSTPQSGIWNLSISPVSVPASGTNLSALIYVTHPLYATVVDDTSTYPPGSSVPISIYAGTIDSPAYGGTVDCTIDTPNGDVDTFALYDDGLHDDENVDDGIYGNIFTDTATTGVYFVNISASVPYDGEMVERTVIQTITINSYPDLTISPDGLLISNTTPDAGDLITFSTTVNNIGDVGVTNASVLILDLIDNSPDVITESVFDIGAGKSVTVDAEWKATPGIHNIIAQVSPFAEYLESDYSNNNVSAVIQTNEYDTCVLFDNVTFTDSTMAEVPIWITNQTDPGYYEVTFLYNDTIISPTDVISDDLDISITSDENGEYQFNGSVKEGKSGLLNVGNITVIRIGMGGKGTNTTIVVQPYDSRGNPCGIEMVDRYVYLSPVHPCANFSVDSDSGETPLPVQFCDLSTGEEITSWHWSFGDGTYSDERNPEHLYTESGSFDVSLMVVNEAGPDIMNRAGYIVVSENTDVVANFISNISCGETPLSVQFTDTTSGNPTSWEWTFGDGTTSTEQNPTHTYWTAGTYDVTLTVSNEYGMDTETKTGYITVTESESPSAFFILNENLVTRTTNDTLPAGDHAGHYGYFMTIVNGGVDASQGNNVLHNLSFSIEPQNITTYGWPAYAVSDGDRIVWNFPESFDLSVGEELSTGVSTATSDAMDYGASLARTVNRTLFTEPGVQHLEFTVTFSDLDFVGSWGRIEYPDSDNVTACKVPYSIETDAPVQWEYGNDQDQFIFNQSRLSVGVPYHFSVDVNVNLNVNVNVNGDVNDRSPVTYKPQIIVWTVSTRDNRTLNHGTNAVVPADMLPENVVRAAAGSDTEADWELIRNNHQVGTLLGVIEAPSLVGANFTANVTSGTVPLTVGFADTSTGNPTSWNWSFGDGSHSTSQSPVNTYELPGTYDVCLEVFNDNGGDSISQVDYITVTAPLLEANFSTNTTAGTAPLAVQFTDASIGVPTEWFWDFGDGNTSTAEDPYHVYVSPGTYQVNLTVNDAYTESSCTGSSLISVAAPPRPDASFHANVTSGEVPLTVGFTDTSTGDITGWLWKFGDGETATDRNATHTYTSSGSFMGSLTVSGPGGNDTAQTTITVNPPHSSVVSFIANVTAGSSPLAVRFTDTSVPTPASWNWSFGDGATSTEQNPVHVYTTDGTYTVTLSVNGDEDTCTRSDYIRVTSVLLGDANGDGEVNQVDTLRVLKEVVGLTTSPGKNTDEFTRTDVHLNAIIDVGDAMFIAQYNVGLRDRWFGLIE